jgi:hypothetical protein
MKSVVIPSFYFDAISCTFNFSSCNVTGAGAREIHKAFEYMLSGAGLRCIIRMGA